MSDETYHGWPNRETWAFHLSITNERATYCPARPCRLPRLVDQILRAVPRPRSHLAASLRLKSSPRAVDACPRHRSHEYQPRRTSPQGRRPRRPRPVKRPVSVPLLPTARLARVVRSVCRVFAACRIEHCLPNGVRDYVLGVALVVVDHVVVNRQCLRVVLCEQALPGPPPYSHHGPGCPFDCIIDLVSIRRHTGVESRGHRRCRVGQGDRATNPGSVLVENGSYERVAAGAFIVAVGVLEPLD
jgi:hypothetical protein